MNKIAVCVSGHLEDYETYAPSLKVLSPYEETEVFIHTWNNLTSHSRENSIYPHLPNISEVFQPKSLYVEDFFNVNKHRFQTFPNKKEINNFINMFYKIKACNDLFHREEDVDEYKMVVRTDSQLYFTQGISEIELYITGKNDKIIYIPKNLIETPYGTACAFGSVRAMRVYSHCIDHIDVLYEDDVPLQKEALLKAHLEKHKITVLPSDVQYEIQEK